VVDWLRDTILTPGWTIGGLTTILTPLWAIALDRQSLFRDAQRVYRPDDGASFSYERAYQAVEGCFGIPSAPHRPSIELILAWYQDWTAREQYSETTKSLRPWGGLSPWELMHPRKEDT